MTLATTAGGRARRTFPSNPSREQFEQQGIDSANIVAGSASNRPSARLAWSNKSFTRSPKRSSSASPSSFNTRGWSGLNSKCGLGVRHRLPARFHQPPHLGADVVFAEHQARRRVGQPRRAAHALDAILQYVLDALWPGHRRPPGPRASPRRPGRVLPRDILQLLSIEFADERHEPLVNPVGQQQYLDVPLFEYFEVRALSRGPKGCLR